MRRLGWIGLKLDSARGLPAFGGVPYVEQFLRGVADSPRHVSTHARIEVLRAEIAEYEARDSTVIQTTVAHALPRPMDSAATPARA